MIDVRCEFAGQDVLGECPLWNTKDQCVYWVDIESRLLRRLHPPTGEIWSWSFPERIGAFAFRSRDHFVVGLESGLYHHDETGLRLLAAPETRSGLRFNDGRCDSRGRFWVGTMDLEARQARGSLYCLDASRTCHRVLTPVGIPNGLAWSPDNRTFYFADSLVRLIYTCDYHPDRLEISGRRVFADLTGQPGLPDGAAIDEDGYLWSAQCNGWALRRYAPDGTLDRVVKLPVQYPTSCCFGGPDLNILYVTSAVWDLTADQLAAQPLAGSLLALDPDVKGLPEHFFAG